MSRRKDVDVRTRWVAAVRRSPEIGDACRVLLLTMAAEGMTQRGYVSIPRANLATMLDRHPQRITERIGEAIKRGFLVRIGSAHEGMTASYAASFPTARANGSAVSSCASETSRANGPAVTSDRLALKTSEAPEDASEVTAERLPNTRATYRNREQAPAPDDSPADRDHDGTPTGAVRESWLPAPFKRPSSDTTAGEVA